MKTQRFLLLTLAIAVAGFVGFQMGLRHTPPIFPEPNEGDRRPLIGVASLTSEAYLSAIRKSGGIPVVLPNTDFDQCVIEDYLERLDALLLPGGADIPPSEYGEKTHETVEILDDQRYHFERAIGKAWIEQTTKPLLGICLGSQWINVLRGGSLIQDIPSALGGNHRSVSHPVQIEPDSRLASIFGELEFEVNSVHHQSVKDVGAGLRIVARSPDGVVEAVEGTDPNRFLIGVQWHPERLMPDDTRQSKLLRAFVEAAKQSALLP